MKRPLQLLFCLLPALQPGSAIADAPGLRLSADTPVVSVMPRNRGRLPLILPELEFQFRIDASCGDDLTPASLLLAVADSRRTFDAGQIESGALSDVRLRIPAKQIAPVVIADFCVAEAESGEPVAAADSENSLTIPATLSAQASLLCVGEGNQSMNYASTTLDIELVCADNRKIAADMPAQR